MRTTYFLLLLVFIFVGGGCGDENAAENAVNSNPAATIPEDGSEPTLEQEGP